MNGLRFRNVDADPADDVGTWPYEALVTAIDRGLVPDWRPRLRGDQTVAVGAGGPSGRALPRLPRPRRREHAVRVGCRPGPQGNRIRGPDRSGCPHSNRRRASGSDQSGVRGIGRHQRITAQYLSERQSHALSGTAHAH